MYVGYLSLRVQSSYTFAILPFHFQITEANYPLNYKTNAINQSTIYNVGRCVKHGACTNILRILLGVLVYWHNISLCST